MKQRIILALLIVFAGLASCSDDDDVVQIKAPIISGLENAYTILEDAELELNPTIENSKDATYVWQVDGKEVAKTLDLVFVQSTPGEYKLVLKAGNEGGVAKQEITVTVVERGSAPIVSDVEEEYNIESGTDLTITPTITSDNETTYSWYLNEEEVATTLAYTFSNAEIGKHEVTFKATNQGGTTEMVFSIVVTPKETSINAVTHKMLVLEIPNYIPADNDGVEWEVLEAPSDYYRLSQMNTAKALFVSGVEGEYLLQVTAGDISGEVKVIVAKAEQTPSAYFANAFDYLPAPGQFVNKMPEYKEGDSHQDMVAKVAKALVGEKASMITLGGWGGYVTMGFDHTIVNMTGKKDFRIEGNGFANSSEPGIIMVSYDANGNGKPDDEWYEIKGSANFTAENEEWYQLAKDNGNDVNTYRDYEMTYHRPKVETTTQLKDYIFWTNNKGKEGYKEKNNFHKQSYYPLWVNDDEITFSGIRLAENGVDESGQGTYFVLKGFKFGYADNHPNKDNGATIDIDWAVDKDGNKANLPGIHFVKIQTGVDQENGWLGENSTEVARGTDLHVKGESIDTLKE